MANVNPFRYRGYYYDSEIELYYCNVRYYDAECGHFLQLADISMLNSKSINNLKLYVYAQNNPVCIAYSCYSVSGIVSTIDRLNFGNSLSYIEFVNDFLSNRKGDKLQPLPSWVNSAITFADVGFSLSLVARTGWYTIRYSNVSNLMKLDGIASIPGKYTNFVNGAGYGFIALETGLDIYSNIQQGQSTGYIIGSAVYTAITGLAIMWISEKIGAYIGENLVVQLDVLLEQ